MKMTVQHVHVAEGGQAIVGNVNAPAEGVGARKKSEEQPHAQLTYAPGVEMSRQVETERGIAIRATSQPASRRHHGRSVSRSARPRHSLRSRLRSSKVRRSSSWLVLTSPRSF